MPKFKQPDGWQPGIYFNMKEQDYHDDSALSHSGLVAALESYFDYWMVSPHNPSRNEEQKRKYEKSDALKFGARCHEFLLDEAAFFEKYSISGAGWVMGKKTIASPDFHEIKESIDEIKAVPEAYAHFQHGMPEVSIIWVDPETGLRQRIRVDYMRTFGGIDYKRARSLQNSLLGKHITDYGYDIQQEFYQQGMLAARAGLRSGKIKAYGDYDKAWLAAFINDEDMLFKFLFQRSTKPYLFQFVAFESDVLENARVHIEDAKRCYLRGVSQFGATRPPAGDASTRRFSIYHLPRRIIDRGDHL